MTVKVVISGEGGAGKTTLIQDLENALLISHDGKKPMVHIPNRYIRSFDSVEELIDLTSDTIEKYNEKYDDYPKVVVFDSVSRIYDTININCENRYTGFSVYTNMDKEIDRFNKFIEDKLIASGIDVVQIAHAIYDSDTAQYKLVGKGSFAKLGGAYSTVEEALFIEKKANKRIVHLKSVKFPARSKQDGFPESMSMEKFSMNNYLSTIRENQAESDDLAL